MGWGILEGDPGTRSPSPSSGERGSSPAPGGDPYGLGRFAPVSSYALTLHTLCHLAVKTFLRAGRRLGRSVMSTLPIVQTVPTLHPLPEVSGP